MHTDMASTGQDVRQKAEETASTIAQQAQETASTIAQQAQQTASTEISSQKDRAASTLDALARSLRDSGEGLREQQPQIATLTDQAARRVEDVSSYVREHDVRDLVSEAERFARREPILFLGGAFAVGFMAARFLKAASPEADYGRSHATAQRQPSYDTYSWRPETGFGSAAGTAGMAGGTAGMAGGMAGETDSGASSAANYGTATADHEAPTADYGAETADYGSAADEFGAGSAPDVAPDVEGGESDDSGSR